jgi:DNA-binding MarR family transcriptional regulator
MSDRLRGLKKKSGSTMPAVGANDRSSSLIDKVSQALVREHPDLDLTHMVLTLYLTTLGRIIEQDFERYCTRSYSMRAADARILIALSRSRPAHAARPTDLFRGLYLTSGAITKQVDRLAAKRLVQRIPDPSHRGGWLIQLTPAGLKLVNGIIVDVARGSAACPELLEMPARQRENVIKFCFQAINAVEASPARSKTRSRSRSKNIR